ncbi:LacI family DNA-binding transcriptional regulator [Comamonas sp. JUb58]|uniref:LacI family DNA-binding transcriptional regulator n=1 Tax=Comamonas sp. JUb58 TaxID=2485114 RepID=UPI00105C86B0|nr:LacI family DNA-binding transcriptional regulator [Comamonas sp. JUb58]TDS69601.1 LacI family transcriptional regulator [Comamonas sp. JUb58]
MKDHQKNPRVPTIKDVAHAAGVSPGTVSRFINGRQRFSYEVEAKIAEAIKSLEYRANPMAQSMITGRSQLLGLCIPDISNPHYAAVIKGATQEASEHGYLLLLTDSEESAATERQLLEQLCMRVDGLIFGSRMHHDGFDWVRKLNKPILFLGKNQNWDGDCLALDNHMAGYMAANHLVHSGHRRIAYVGFKDSLADQERFLGIQELMQEHGQEVSVFRTEQPSPEAGGNVGSMLLLGSKPPDAVICFNDMLAIGFMTEASRLGFSVPRQCSVIGFDNISFCDYLSPRLTSVDFGGERIGRVAVRRILAMIDNREAPDDSLFLHPRIVLRESTK